MFLSIRLHIYIERRIDYSERVVAVMKSGNSQLINGLAIGTAIFGGLVIAFLLISAFYDKGGIYNR